MPRTLWRVAMFGCVIMLTELNWSAHSHGLNLPEAEYPYRVVDQDVSVILKEFGQNLGIRVKLSSKVSGRVRGGISKSSALIFLNNVCRLNGLDWYYDGSILHVTSAEEQATRFLPVSKDAVAKLMENLARLSFYDERFPIRVGPDNASMVISGPPAYVTLVEQTLSSTRQGSPDMPSQTLVYRGASVSIEKFEPSGAR